MLIDGITMCSNVLPDPKVKITINSVKEITDDEIIHISLIYDLDNVLGLIDFARAVLKKAQGS